MVCSAQGRERPGVHNPRTAGKWVTAHVAEEDDPVAAETCAQMRATPSLSEPNDP